MAVKVRGAGSGYSSPSNQEPDFQGLTGWLQDGIRGMQDPATVKYVNDYIDSNFTGLTNQALKNPLQTFFPANFAWTAIKNALGGNRPKGTVGNVDPGGFGKPRLQGSVDLGEAMDFWDYLKLAEQLGGGGRVDYTPLMDRARANQAQGDARLAALFSRLQGEIAADRPGIEQTFSNASQSIGQAGDDTRSLINAAYDQAAQQRAQQLAALGIQDAAVRDEYSSGDQAAAIARTAERQNVGQNQVADNQATALNYNTQIQQATGQQGAEYRAALERALFDRLAELDIAQQEANAGAQDRVLDTAFRFASNPTLFDPVARASAAAQQDFENQMSANRFALDQYKAMGSQRTLEEVLGNLGGVQQAAQAYGIGNDSQSLNDFIELLLKMGYTP